MENSVCLNVLSSTLSPEQICDQLGMHGDDTWRIGDKRKNTKILEKENGWAHKSRVKKSAHLEDHIESIMDLVRSFECKFKAISELSDCDVQLSCAVYGDDEPPLFFETKIIGWLSDIGASLDIDLYLSGNRE